LVADWRQPAVEGRKRVSPKGSFWDAVKFPPAASQDPSSEVDSHGGEPSRAPGVEKGSWGALERGRGARHGRETGSPELLYRSKVGAAACLLDRGHERGEG
jgi:hypothetical protein